MSGATPKTRQITIEALRQAFNYDCGTGLITWRIRLSSRAGAGDIAGRANQEGYLRMTLNSTTILAHRVAWALHHGAWPSGILDHANGVRTDNRIENLRECDATQNSANRGVSPNNTHGTKGVTLLPHGKWQAQIRAYGKSKYLGSFADKDDAARAYSAAAKEAFGEFVRAPEVSR